MIREFNTNLSQYFKNPFKKAPASADQSAAPAPAATTPPVDADAAANAAYAKRMAANQGKAASPELMGGAKKRSDELAARENNAKKIIAQVWKEFNASVQEFQKSIRDRAVKMKNQTTARHVWRIVELLTKHVEQSSNEYLSSLVVQHNPALLAQRKAEYQKALTTHANNHHSNDAYDFWDKK